MSSRPTSGETTAPGTPERSAGNDHATESLQEGLEQCHLTPPTSSASILTRPSSAGSEHHASPFGTDQDALNEPYYDPAFQSAIKYAADTARNIAEVLEDCPRSEPTIATLKQEARSLSSYRSLPSRIVGLIGQSGQGKSSLINSLLDVAELAVTGESGNAVTAFVVEYKYKQESQTSRFRIEASCLQSEEIDKHLEELLHQYLQPFIPSRQDLSTEEFQAAEERSEIAQCIIDAAFSSFEGFSLESFKDQDVSVSLSVLRAHAKRFQWPQGMQDGEWSGVAQTVEECHELMGPFMDNGLWPFIHSMTVYLDSMLLRSGIILADLPGYHDVNYARVRNAHRYQSKCDELFVVADIKRAIADPVIKEAVKNHTGAADRVGEISSPNITVVCTHSATFTKSTRALRSTKNAPMIKEAMAKIQTLESQNLGTGLETRRVLEEANFALKAIFMQERNEEVKQALQKAYAKEYDPSLIPVYCVDNSLYLDHADSLRAHAISGIPFLRRHTISLLGKALFRGGDNFLRTHVPAVVLSLQIWLEASKGDQTCSLSSEVFVEEWFSKVDTAVGDLQEHVASAYKVSIKRPLQAHQEEVISRAQEVCHSWRSLHVSSFRALIRNWGTHETHALGYRCWNTELVDCLNAVTAVRWAELDNTAVERFQALIALANDDFESMRKELSLSQAPASLLKSFVHRKKQVDEALETNFEDFMRHFRFSKQLATTGGRGSYVLEYMIPMYDQCGRDGGKGVMARNVGKLSSHVGRPEFVTSQVNQAHQDLLRFVEEATQRMSRDVTTIISAIKADLKMLESPSKTLAKKHPEYVQRLQDTLDAARRVAEEIETQAEPARTKARERGYIS